MTLQLEIVSEHRDIVGDDAVRQFAEDGGSIGRSLQNDWILPDPDRYISGKHAVIDYKGGIYYLVDLSTNGVYVNDEHEPIGKGNPRRLFNGDRLRLGDFEMVVTIDKGESLAMPLDADPDAMPEDVEQSVPEASIRTGVELLDEEEITGGDDFVTTLFTGSSDDDASLEELLDEISMGEAPSASAVDADSFEAAESGEETPEPAGTEPVMQSTRVEVSPDDLFDSFLDGLGLSRSELHPSIDPAEVLQNVGEVMREFVEGMAGLLASRANLKSAFSLDQTTVLPRHNNPLKLSQDTTASIKQLLVGREGEYLGPRDAVREVCRDLLFHQDAFLDAMTDAFVEFADRFDPDELNASFAQNTDSKSLFGFLNKRNNWQAYCDLYPTLTEKGGGRFPAMFAEEFVRSYERHISDFKRVNPAATAQPVPALEPATEEELAEELKKTIKLYDHVPNTINTDLDDEDSASTA